MRRGGQAVKGLVAEALPGLSKESLEGREVDGAIIDLVPRLGGLACDGAHSYEFWKCLGRREGDTGCEAPNMLRCVLCSSTLQVRCKATRDDRCLPCAERHRKDIARVMRSGFTDDRSEGFFFVTLTGPGKAELPWDLSVCGHADDSECAGPLGCRVDRHVAAIWNGTAAQRWSWFVTALRRRLRADVQVCGSWETHQRGVLHRHFLMWSPPAHEGVRRETHVKAVRTAVRWCATRKWIGFGRQSDVQGLSGGGAREMARKAGYCAKYATKGDDLAVTLDCETGELVQGGYRRWSASRRWGTSMRCVRADRVQWVREQLSGCGGATEEHAAPSTFGAAGALDLDSESYARVIARMAEAGAFGS